MLRRWTSSDGGHTLCAYINGASAATVLLMFSETLRRIAAAVDAMHAAGVSESQISSLEDILTFLESPNTRHAVSSGLASLAAIAGRKLHINATAAFLLAFDPEGADCAPAREVVGRFSTGLKTFEELECFLAALHRFAVLAKKAVHAQLNALMARHAGV